MTATFKSKCKYAVSSNATKVKRNRHDGEMKREREKESEKKEENIKNGERKC